MAKKPSKEAVLKTFNLALIALLVSYGLEIEVPDTEEDETPDEEADDEPKSKSGKKGKAKEEAEEETEDDDTVTLETLRAKAKKVLKLEDGEDKLTAILKKFGEDTISDADEDNYEGIDAKLQKLLDTAE